MPSPSQLETSTPPSQRQTDPVGRKSVKTNLNSITYTPSCSVVSDSATPWIAVYQAPVHSDSPGKNTGVGCHALLQGIFPTQGSNPGLPHSRQILLLSEPPDKSQMYIIDVRCTYLILYIDDVIQQQQNTHFSQAHMESSSREATFWTTKHTVTNLKEEISYNVCSQITMEWKLEISNRKITGKPTNIWRVRNTLLNNTRVKEISKGIQNYFKLNENTNTTFHNLWRIVETVFKEKHTALILILEKKKDLKSII